MTFRSGDIVKDGKLIILEYGGDSGKDKKKPTIEVKVKKKPEK